MRNVPDVTGLLTPRCYLINPISYTGSASKLSKETIEEMKLTARE